MEHDDAYLSRTLFNNQLAYASKVKGQSQMGSTYPFYIFFTGVKVPKGPNALNTILAIISMETKIGTVTLRDNRANVGDCNAEKRDLWKGLNRPFISSPNGQR
ncbi:hypothetical protein FE257_011011 [Aspergillus nanangensis]|uniref:Uncharacterized protein n=1 Tax=Aspergillus nanangensis TaxID=2582783 RepID=A0AAD4GSZ0_ASPNN|nr:hypothetical protein FE257_011011 [Aspergillus nanangensis]